MGLLDKIFPKHEKETWNGKTYWQLLNGYSPIFHTWNGELYESELVRAAIDARSRHIAKLRVELQGAAQPRLQTRLKRSPNGFQTWYQFLYRLNTVLDMQDTAFIIPVLDQYGETIGITTCLPRQFELINVEGEPWLRFEFYNGEFGSCELYRVGILTKFQYESDLFGSNNKALQNTMALLDIQRQGIQEAVKNSTTYRFWAKASNFSKTSDLKKERQRFSEENLTASSDGGGILLFPNTYTEIHQADVKPFTVDYNTMTLIQTNVYNYFGVSSKILQNSAEPVEMDAFFNGAVEPFAIQLQEVLTKMLFTDNEVSYGSGCVVSSNRLQYMTTSQKVEMTKELGDRGALMIDEIRALFNYPPLPDGKGQYVAIRGEYKDVSDLGSVLSSNYLQEETNENADKE